MTQLKNLMAAMVLSGALLVAAEPVDMAAPATAKTLAERAKEAKTAKDHLDLAVQYERRAKALEAKASAHDTEADGLLRRQSNIPMSYKWPGMVNGLVDKQRNQALQARRAAKESYERVAFHKAEAARLEASAE
ncbi:hypothetical protein WDZ92_26345 [Nostoc sp. NIES-2111]